MTYIHAPTCTLFCVQSARERLHLRVLADESRAERFIKYCAQAFQTTRGLRVFLTTETDDRGDARDDCIILI